MSQPQNLLEAYYSIYEEPINEEYLTEEDQYCYDVAEFLLDEGFTEEEIIALTEEENFLEILEYIEEKMTPADYRSLSRHGKKRLRQSGMKLQDPHEYKGAAAKKSREGVQSRRAERQAWDDATPRQKEIAKRGRESEQRVKLAKLETEAEKIHQDNKKAEAAKKPSKTLVGKIKSGIEAGIERDKAAREKFGKVAKGVGEYLKAKHGAKVARGLGKTSASDEAIERRARQKAQAAVKEDYFDIVADYLLENFEFESEEHFYSTMASLDEEVIDNIVDEILSEETPQERQARWASSREGAPATPQERARMAAMKANKELNRQYRERQRQAAPVNPPTRALPKASAPVARPISRPVVSAAPKPTPRPAVPQGQGTVGGLRTVGGQGTATNTGSLPSPTIKVAPTAPTAPVAPAAPQPKAPIIRSIFKDKSNPLSR